MNRWIFGGEIEDEAASIFRKLTMGVMLGLAIGWVLLRIRRPGSKREGLPKSGVSSDEIDITGFEASEFDVSQSLVNEESEESPELLSATSSQQVLPKATRGRKAKKDRLEDINGIGPVYAKRMNAAGIFTYADLAEQDPERLTEIVQAKSWQAVAPEEWIAQARAKIQ